MVLLTTQGSKFWSSKVCEGGESREAYACQLNFDPTDFSSKLMITWLDFFENLILIRFQTVRKLNFDPVRTNDVDQN